MKFNTPFSTKLSGSAKETELRLRNIFQWKKQQPPVIFLALVLVLALGCGGLVACHEDPAPTTRFPLEESAVIAALEDQGLDWTVDHDEKAPAPTDDHSSFGLIRPDSGVGYPTVMLDSALHEEVGPYLVVHYITPKSQLEADADREWTWEDFRSALELSARLYGSFEDPKELSAACAETSLSTDVTILYEGALTGGYCRVQVSSPIAEWSPYFGGKSADLVISIFEDEGAYQTYRELTSPKEIQLESYDAHSAVVLEATELEDPYLWSIRRDGKIQVGRLPEAAVETNQLVLVIRKKDGCALVIPEGSEPPMPHGWIDSSKLSTDPEQLSQANQAHLESAPVYDSIDGVESSVETGIIRVLERQDSWALVELSGGAGQFWVKSEDLIFQYSMTVKEPVVD